MKKILAIIPARSGSKRIPKKNIKNFLGFPIIKYTIEAALNSKCFTKIMISTDSKEIAEIAKKYGAECPFYRSKKNSSDTATTAEVILEVLKNYEAAGEKYEYVCCLYPAAPFITAQKIKEGLKILESKKAEAVIPVVKYSYPIQRALQIKNNSLSMINPKNINIRTQDLTAAFHDAGQFYWLNTAAFIKQNKIFANKSLPLILADSEVQDIDTEEDWKIAELKYKILNS